MTLPARKTKLAPLFTAPLHILHRPWSQYEYLFSKKKICILSTACMSLTYRFRNTLAIRQREEYMYTMLVLSCHTFNTCIGKWKTSKQTFKASTVLVRPTKAGHRRRPYTRPVAMGTERRLGRRKPLTRTSDQRTSRLPLQVYAQRDDEQPALS